MQYVNTVSENILDGKKEKKKVRLPLGVGKKPLNLLEEVKKERGKEGEKENKKKRKHPPILFRAIFFKVTQ